MSPGQQIAARYTQYSPPREKASPTPFLVFDAPAAGTRSAPQECSTTPGSGTCDLTAVAAGVRAAGDPARGAFLVPTDQPRTYIHSTDSAGGVVVARTPRYGVDRSILFTELPSSARPAPPSPGGRLRSPGPLTRTSTPVPRPSATTSTSPSGSASGRAAAPPPRSTATGSTRPSRPTRTRRPWRTSRRRSCRTRPSMPSPSPRTARADPTRPHLAGLGRDRRRDVSRFIHGEPVDGVPGPARPAVHPDRVDVGR